MKAYMRSRHDAAVGKVQPVSKNGDTGDKDPFVGLAKPTKNLRVPLAMAQKGPCEKVEDVVRTECIHCTMSLPNPIFDTEYGTLLISPTSLSAENEQVEQRMTLICGCAEKLLCMRSTTAIDIHGAV